MLKRILAGQDGVSAVIIAIVMVGLLGFAALVVDAGMLLETRRQLQNGVDAAAMAGAQQIAMDVSGSGFNAANATGQAYAYADLNGVPGAEVQEVSIIQVFNPNDAVRVTARREVDLLFAPVLGIASRSVSAQATAIVTQLSFENIWPWGITRFDTEDVAEGEVITLKVGTANSPAPGNFLALDFFGKGGKDYENFIKYGYNGYVPPYSESNPWMVPTETGNLVGPTNQGVDYLKDLAETTTFSTNDVRHPLVGMVPILSDDTWVDLNGKKPVEVIDFYIFYLYGVDEDEPGGQAAVTGTFKKRAYGVGRSRNIGGGLENLIGARLWQ